MRKLLFTVLFLIFGSYALLAYYPDQPLKPDVENWLDWEARAIPPSSNLFLALLGFHSDADQDPVQTAVDMVSGFNSSLRTARAADNYRLVHYDAYWETPALDFQGSMPGGCALEGRGCVVVYGEQSDSLLSVATKNAVLLKRYRDMYDFPDYQNTLIADSAAPQPHMDGLLHANELNAAHAGALYALGDKNRGRGMIENDIRFVRKLLQQTDSQAMKVTAARMLQNSLLVYSEMMEQSSIDGFSLIADLSDAERSMESLLKRQFQQVAADNRYRLQIDLRGGLLVPDWLLKPVAKPNHAANLQFLRFQSLLFFDKLTAPELLDRYASGDVDYTPPLEIRDYITDPVGAYMLTHGRQANYISNYFRAYDLAGLIRLINVKLQIKRAGLAREAVAKYLEQAGADSRNIYDASALRWDASRGWLFYQSPYEDNGEIGVRLRIN